MIGAIMKELLIPVGSMDALRVAVHAGADAVYLGGKRFGARAFAQNFSDEEMIEAIKIGSDDLTSIGSDTIASAQSYLDTVARTAKSSAEIEFAKKGDYV